MRSIRESSHFMFSWPAVIAYSVAVSLQFVSLFVIYFFMLFGKVYEFHHNKTLESHGYIRKINF